MIPIINKVIKYFTILFYTKLPYILSYYCLSNSFSLKTFAELFEHLVYIFYKSYYYHFNIIFTI